MCPEGSPVPTPIQAAAASPANATVGAHEKGAHARRAHAPQALLFTFPSGAKPLPQEGSTAAGQSAPGTQDSRLHRVRRWWVLESGLRFRKCRQVMPPRDVCPSHTTRLGWFSPFGPKPPNTSVTQEGNSQQGKDTGKAPRRSTVHPQARLSQVEAPPHPSPHLGKPPQNATALERDTLRTGTLAAAPGQPATLLPRLPTPCPLHAIFRFPTHPLPEYFSPKATFAFVPPTSSPPEVALGNQAGQRTQPWAPPSRAARSLGVGPQRGCCSSHASLHRSSETDSGSAPEIHVCV